jgi:hypothetical protein
VFLKKIAKQNKGRKFNEFKNNYIKQSERIYYSYNELVLDPPEADVYIVGSDQVWNPDYTPKQYRAYFLDFGKTETKRIAYAASFGKDAVNEDFRKAISPLLKRFNYISVREKSGVDICWQCGVKAEWVPDPTLLLSTTDYRALYQSIDILNNEKPYCLLYLLSNTHDFPIEAIYDWAKKINIEVRYVTGNSKYDNNEKIYATIPEWLYLIDNAEYVITNSFHCSVFSLLFKKKFGIIPLTRRSAGTNSRFDSLFGIFGIKPQFMDNSFTALDTNIDWSKMGNTFKNIQNSCNLLAHIQ